MGRRATRGHKEAETHHRGSERREHKHLRESQAGRLLEQCIVTREAGKAACDATRRRVPGRDEDNQRQRSRGTMQGPARVQGRHKGPARVQGRHRAEKGAIQTIAKVRQECGDEQA